MGLVCKPRHVSQFEIQLPQDDYNLLAWQLGRRIAPDERPSEVKRSMLRVSAHSRVRGRRCGLECVSLFGSQCTGVLVRSHACLCAACVACWAGLL